MKGMVLYHPWAWFTMPTETRPPRKRLETRAQPIGGLDGAIGRSLPGCRAEPGERVAVIAGLDTSTYRRLLREATDPDSDAAWIVEALATDGVTSEYELPWGAILGTVRLGVAYRMTDRLLAPGADVLLIDGDRLRLVCWPSDEDLYAETEPTMMNISDQRRLGDFAPNRWAMELDDAVRLRTPVPILGRQGLHHLRDTEETAIPCPLCQTPTMATSHLEDHEWCPACGWVDE